MSPGKSVKRTDVTEPGAVATGIRAQLSRILIVDAALRFDTDRSGFTALRVAVDARGGAGGRLSAVAARDARRPVGGVALRVVRMRSVD